jgi:hypothetical protein
MIARARKRRETEVTGGRAREDAVTSRAPGGAAPAAAVPAGGGLGGRRPRRARRPRWAAAPAGGAAAPALPRVNLATHVTPV